MKTIDTLVKDVQDLLENGHAASEQSTDELGRDIARTVSRRLREANEAPRDYKLYLSAIGKPDRQIWYDANYKGNPEKLKAKDRLKFLTGDILEHILLFLAKEAGHEVQDQQGLIEVDGIRGRIDARIDGVVVDTKSTSSFAFDKFEDGSLRHKDDFGYMWQLAAYSEGGAKEDGAFYYVDKQLGKTGLMRCSREELALYPVRERIAELKKVIKLPEPPERCYDPVPDGKSGNMKLAVGCAYCRHKEECWPGLRTFIYSTGPRFLTKVERLPDVPEVNIKEAKEDLVNE